MDFYRSERTALFIDGANLYATSKSLGFEIDYKRLLTYFQDQGKLIRAYYYTPVAEEQEYSSVRPLIDWLDYNGYTVVTKQTKEYIDNAGRRRSKARVEIEFAVDALMVAPHLDHIIMFAGDGAFRALAAALQAQGKRVTVVSTLQSKPPMVADELRRQADQFIDIGDLEDAICRENDNRSSRANADGNLAFLNETG